MTHNKNLKRESLEDSSKTMPGHYLPCLSWNEMTTNKRSLCSVCFSVSILDGQRNWHWNWVKSMFENCVLMHELAAEVKNSLEFSLFFILMWWLMLLFNFQVKHREWFCKCLCTQIWLNEILNLLVSCRFRFQLREITERDNNDYE